MNLMTNLVGRDPTFEVDTFNKPKLTEEAETIINTILFLLFLVPGQFPSLPNLGLDIKSKLYTFYDDLDPNLLQQQLVEQCKALSVYFEQGDIQIRKMVYRNMHSLIIYVNTSDDTTMVQNFIGERNKKNQVEYFIGLSLSELQEIILNVNKKFIDMQKYN